jgi:hypothetical protein
VRIIRFAYAARTSESGDTHGGARTENCDS